MTTYKLTRAELGRVLDAAGVLATGPTAGNRERILAGRGAWEDGGVEYRLARSGEVPDALPEQQAPAGTTTTTAPRPAGVGYTEDELIEAMTSPTHDPQASAAAPADITDAVADLLLKGAGIDPHDHTGS